MKKRIIGIDTIKILAVMFVPSLHFFINYGFINEPYIGMGRIIQESVRWISFSCIGLFIMSTGYFQCDKDPSKKYYKKIIKYIIVYIIYAFCTGLIVVFDDMPIYRNIIRYIFKFPGSYWYMSFFIGFYLLIPYFNLTINNISNKKDFIRLIIILIIIISIPDFVNNIPPLWRDWKYIYLPSWWKEFYHYYIIF